MRIVIPKYFVLLAFRPALSAGSIPKELEKLQVLVELHLYSNELSGDSCRNK